MARRKIELPAGGEDQSGTLPTDLPVEGELITTSTSSACEEGIHGDLLMFLSKENGRPWTTFRAPAGPVIIVSGATADDVADEVLTLEVTAVRRKGDQAKGRATIYARRVRPSMVHYD